MYHRLRVVKVVRESDDVVSVVVTGRNLERLAVSGGQYFQWRFMARGLWLQAHPYSISALPQPPYMRVTMAVVESRHWWPLDLLMGGDESPRCFVLSGAMRLRLDWSVRLDGRVLAVG